jgi:hypothetical protein
MSAPMLTIMVIVAIGLVYVALPVMADVYARFRRRRTVVCPETGLDATVRIDAWHAALTAIPGPPRRYVAECSRWPEHAMCRQECLSDPALP